LHFLQKTLHHGNRFFVLFTEDFNEKPLEVLHSNHSTQAIYHIIYHMMPLILSKKNFESQEGARLQPGWGTKRIEKQQTGEFWRTNARLRSIGANTSI